MAETTHPLTKYLAETNQTVTAFAERVGVSRMLVYRVINGGNTSVERIRQISAATNGAVSIGELIAPAEADRRPDLYPQEGV